mmetsp:Transcript_10164/g.44205  ORF Transcript_10164/g.44205 Transcript_10164/m.44205 type:complete len:263 (+) Transcript_10164:1098-1886(+)
MNRFLPHHLQRRRRIPSRPVLRRAWRRVPTSPRARVKVTHAVKLTRARIRRNLRERTRRGAPRRRRRGGSRHETASDPLETSGVTAPVAVRPRPRLRRVVDLEVDPGRRHPRRRPRRVWISRPARDASCDGDGRGGDPQGPTLGSPRAAGSRGELRELAPQRARLRVALAHQPLELLHPRLVVPVALPQQRGLRLGVLKLRPEKLVLPAVGVAILAQALVLHRQRARILVDERAAGRVRRVGLGQHHGSRAVLGPGGGRERV